MNKALEDLQAGRDPFAVQEEESNGDFFCRMALWSLCLSIMTAVLCKCGTDIPKSLNLDPKTAHTIWLVWLTGSYVLFSLSAIMGVIAFFGIRKHGADGILARAMLGVLVSGACLALLLTGAVHRGENRMALATLRDSEDQIRLDMQKELNQRGSVGLTNYQRQAQKMKDAMDNASEKMTGNEALVFKAGSAVIGKLQLVMNDYTAAATPMLQPTFISMNGVVQPQQLQAKKEMVAKFMSANEKVLEVVQNADKTFTEEMNRLQVPTGAQAAALKDFQAGFYAQNNVLVKIREKDRQMGTALMGLFNLLDANWGRWEFNSDTKKVLFQDEQALAKFNAFLKDVVTAGREQTELQRQYLTAQSKGG